MKQIIAICALALSFNTYSSCSDDFSQGVSNYEFAMNYFESGSSNYQRALDESRGQGRGSIICDALLQSNTGFNVAANSFEKCTEAFTNAMSSCNGQSRDIALENKNVCVGNYDVAQGNYEQILSTLKATCFKSSESVGVELETIIQEL